MGKKKIDLKYVNDLAKNYIEKNYSAPKWLQFSKYFILKGFEVYLAKSKSTVSKYIYVEDMENVFKVRFSNHKPNKNKEVAEDCNFFVGRTNLRTTTTEQAVLAAEIFFKNREERFKMLEIYDFNNWVRKYIHAGADMHKFIMSIVENTNQQIWIADGFKCNDRRRKIYPNYKRGRVSPGEDVFEFMDFVKKCLKHMNVTLIEVPYYEADDVIALLAEKLSTTQKVKIFSSDADMWALKTLPNVSLTRDTFKCEPKYTTLYKAIVGDKSDNIPGVPGVGHVTFMKMIEKGEIADKIKNNEALINKLLKVVSFIKPSMEEVIEGSVEGKEDREQLNGLMKEVGLVSLNELENAVEMNDSFDLDDFIRS